MGDDIEAFEGPNELDNRGDPAWAATLRAYMPALAAAVQRQAPGVPVIGPSFVNAGSRGYLPTDLPGLVNGHPYPGGEPPEPTLGAELARLREPADARPVVFTETGYHNALNAAVGQPPASEEAVATYLPRLLLTAFGAGVRRTFIYELVDVQDEPGLADPEAHFGLLRSDLSPKPAFTAIQRLIKALRSAPAKSSGRALSWRLRGAEEGQVQRLMLRRQDGSHALALWRPVSVWDRDARQPIQPDPLRVELILERGTRDMVVWRPSVAEGPVLRRAAAERLALDLEGDVVLVGLR
jgi:hypothetical protein